MKFENKSEVLAAMGVKYKEMEACESQGEFDAKSAEFAELESALKRFEALEAAEKAYAAAAAPVEAKEAGAEGAIAKDEPEAGYEADVKAFAAAARKNFSEGVPADGGYTVPEAISTKINKLRDAKFSLRRLVSVRNVKASSGEDTYQKRGAGAGFSSISEGGKIPKIAGPKFFRLPWKVEKYGGFMFATNELLSDTDANIVGTVTEWFAENARVTDNLIVLATLREKYTRTENPESYEVIEGLGDLKRILNVKLGQTFAPTSSIVTNDDGLQWLDTLKDKEGRTLIKENENDPLKRYISVGFRKVPLEVVPNSDLPTDATKGAPVIVGDLKEGCQLIDRNALSIKASDTAAIGTGDDAVNAYSEDLTVWRGLERLDCRLKDEASYYMGHIKPETAASAGAGESGTQGAGDSQNKG